MEEEEEHYITEIANGIINLKKYLERDVIEMCALLELLCKEIFQNRPDLPDAVKTLLKSHFQDIYRSLKLHLVFHPVSPQLHAHKKLGDLGLLIGLNAEELERQPDENSALEYSADPWSKLMEIFDAKSSEEPGRKHAENVMDCIAKDFLRFLSSNNIFKPKVLAKVSHSDKWSVGSSIAVSPFLRPLCLHQRIRNFKPSLKKAIVIAQPLHVDTAYKNSWSSSAFGTGTKWKRKDPCKNCGRMFGNLEGFPSSEKGKNGTFLAACAEYCAVDQLLPVEVLSENDDPLINAALERNKTQCMLYFKNFREIENKCIEACNTEDKRLRNEKIRNVFREIRPLVHIFGRKPECNEHFGDSN